MRQDLLADVLSAIKNAETVGKKEAVVPASKLIKDVLKVMKEEGYIGDLEFIEDGKSGKLKVSLIQKVTRCNVIKPRQSTKIKDLDKWERRYLPSKDCGILILSTPQGVMTHRGAKEKHVGGVLLSYIY